MMVCWLQMMKCGTRDIIILLLSSTKETIHTIGSILIRISSRSNPSFSSPKERMIPMKKMTERVPGSLIILTLPRIETFMVSSDGFLTSTLSALKTMMLDTSLTENILMAPPFCHLAAYGWVSSGLSSESKSARSLWPQALHVLGPFRPVTQGPRPQVAWFHLGLNLQGPWPTQARPRAQKGKAQKGEGP